MDNYEIRREDIPKFFHLYQNCGKIPKEIEPETNEAKESSGDTSTDGEVNVVSDSDSVQLDCGSNISEECGAGVGLKSASSCSSLTIHVCTYEDCDKFFSRPSRLAQHIRTHTGERPYVCPSAGCLRSYTRQQHLKRHIETSHQDKETEDKFKCEMCDTMTSNIYALRKHVNRIHGTKKYECNECGESFMKQQHLQSHTYAHTGIKPYPCDYPECEMRCLTPSVLKRHKLIHQKSRYVCPQESCQQKFDVHRNLQRHISTDHPKVCDICGRPYKQLRSLKRHRLTHRSSVEAYFCTYPACNKYYVQLRNLMAHIKDKHQHLTTYECGVCEKHLSSKQRLIHHMTTHSPTYKRNYASEKPRKPRKDKGCSRLDFARLLSGYSGDEEEDDLPQVTQPETILKKTMDAGASLDALHAQSENTRRDFVLESDENS